MIFNWHKKEREERTMGDVIADAVASFVGSWPFVILHIVWFTAWMYLRIEPFPYGLLTMIVSLEAIFLSTLVMMSQNREADRDRVQAAADYETNVKAKEEIEELQKSLARIENEKLDTVLRILEKR